MSRQVSIGLVLGLCLIGGAAVAQPQEPDSFTDAAKQPLRDLNLIREQIPPVLLDATEAPYAMPRPYTCAQIAALIAPLDDALGPDLDAPEGAEPGLLTRGRGAAVNLLENAAGGLLPFRSWFRKLSGRERFERTVRAAVDAGGVRRAFLKGLGQARNCRLPASPRVEALITQPMGVVGRERQKGPRYPIR